MMRHVLLVTLLAAVTGSAEALARRWRPRRSRRHRSPAAPFKDQWLRSFSDSGASLLSELRQAGAAKFGDHALNLVQGVPAQGVVALPVLPEAKNHTVEAVADAWFHKLKPGTVSKQMVDGAMLADTGSCGTIQVIGNEVFTPGRLLRKKFYNSRMLDLALLFQRAAARSRLPDVDMVFCASDAGDSRLQSTPHFGRLPVLAPVSRLTSAATIPVPMLARSHRSFWGDPQIQAMLSGRHVFRRVGWGEKVRQAFFRGALKRGCGDLGGGPPSPRSHCFRNYMVHRLAGVPEFNVSGAHAPEEDFENYMVLLVLGNSGGWSDRTMSTLFKSSAALYVDQSAYEWFMPALDDRVHYIKAEPNADDVIEKVRWALNHSAEVQNITRNANERASYLFNADSIANYMSRVVKRYASILDYVPTLRDNMEKF